MRQPTIYRHESLWDFMSEVEKAFDDFWRTGTSPTVSQTAPTGNGRGESFTPAVDLQETKEFYLVSMDLPGVAEKDVQIDVQHGRLTVRGERARETKEEGLFKRYERSYGRFERSFALPQDVNTDAIQARFENGVLEVLVPKAEIAKPRTIAINQEKGGLFSRLIGQKGAAAKNESESH